MTNPTAIARQIVDEPQSAQYQYGVFSVVTPRTDDGSHWRGGVRWRAQSCGNAHETSGPCVDSTSAVGNWLSPDFYGCDVVAYDPFIVYAYNNDSVAGASMDIHRANAINRLTTGEQEIVEEHLWALLAANAPVSAPAQAGIVYALGYVEQALAERYGNKGVIHMSRLAATMAIAGGGALRVSGSQLVTALGTPVVAGGGYNKIGLSSPTTATVYGTGPLVAYRGPIETVDQPGAQIDRAVNSVSLTAQRDYVIGWDCVVVGVTAAIL